MESLRKPAAGSAPAITADDQVARVFAWRRGFNVMHLIDLGIELGLFRALAEKPGVTTAQLANALGLAPASVATWCLTAYAFELLEVDEDLADDVDATRGSDAAASGNAILGKPVRLAPFIDQLFGNPTHPRYLGGYVQLGTRHAAEDFRFARTAYKDGAVQPFQGRSDDFARLIGEGIAGVNAMVARKILPTLAGLDDRLKAGGSLLEVGCGTGNLLRQVAKAYPSAKLTGVDIDPTGLAAVRAAIASAGLNDRISVLEGDVATVAPPAAFDVAVMVEVLHEISPALRAHVFEGVARALRPGGWLLIVDETYPSTLAEARQPEFRFPVQTGFEELTWGNVIPTRAEQERLLAGAGFDVESAQRSIVGEGFTVLAAQLLARD